ncbi:MAG: pyruvate dehydrogenase (acetyl-transferring) E1 component subunit alpha [Chloroflexi bacterium]|nr:pyruvate dehydrogenase (acetyl-transferring) E1 component subunit alpha [Chloroflexota bacterium]|tara:strand:- start:10077 stop:11057 length:981 start_codon:yes stop_codon:yes gene_type:complete
MQVLEKTEIQPSELLNLYRDMKIIRLFEEKCSQLYMQGKIRGFLHLYIGEEAIAVGLASALNEDDHIITHYRDHGHALARGLEPRAIMAELCGKATGTSFGRGGSMHIFDASKNFAGGHAIVGGHLPLAAGLALAAKQLNEDRIVVCFFGDGALNQGEFHETMNLASVWKLPVLFFLENNFYGMGSHIDRTFAGGSKVHTIADRYKIPNSRIDGMDVLAVREASIDAIAKIRKTSKPYLLEAVTYRFQGHSMADPVTYRDRDEVDKWRPRDPIALLKEMLLEAGHASEKLIGRLDEEANLTVEDATQFAESSPDPDPNDLTKNIYA